MEGSIPSAVLSRNQDPFRSLLPNLPTYAIERALSWLRGEGLYPPPISIHLNLTLRCTARCVHCNQWAWPAHKELSFEQLSELLGVLRAWNVRTLTLAGGNPLLYHHFVPMLELAYRSGLHVGVVTEGMNMTAEMVQAIGRLTAWIRFSLDGPTPEIHDDIRSAPGLFNVVIESIQRLRSYNPDLPIGLNCVVQRRNFRHLAEMINLAERLEATGVFFKIPHGDDPHGRYLLSATDWAEFVSWLDRNCGRLTSVQTNVRELRSLLSLMVDIPDAARGRPLRAFYQKSLVHCFVPLFFFTCDSEANAYPCDYLQADTRSWGGRYEMIRNEFCLGNILSGPDRVLARAADLMRRRIHDLPSNGYDECGNCTRFCQLNAGLTKINSDLVESRAAADALRAYIQQIRKTGPEDAPFL